MNNQESFSKNLRELREIAILLTQNRRIRVKYDNNAKVSYFNPEIDEIILSLNPYPQFVKSNSVVTQKVLDGITTHESGHYKLSKPLWNYLNQWVTKIKRNNGSVYLAKEIVNLIEDIRVDYFMELRYRFDFGKRLALRRLILKDSIENQLKHTIINYNPRNEAPLIIAILFDKGKYKANTEVLESVLSPQAKIALNKCLSLLDECRFYKLRIDLIRTNQTIYDLIIPFLSRESELPQLIPSVDGGNFKGEVSSELQKEIESQIAQELKEIEEKKLEELKRDLAKGLGGGEGKGEEIDAPNPNYVKYQELVDRNKPEITRLLNKLKETIKPIVKRDIFQSRGRIQANLQSKAYVNSFRNVIKNVYLNTNTTYEKEKVAIGFLFDFSGSVEYDKAEDITTVLSEVFRQYVDDSSYAIACFGVNNSRIKTFFELSENTKARIGNININRYGTIITPLLSSFLKMFNTISNDKRKILVIATDFQFEEKDSLEALEIIKLYALTNVELIFLGFSNANMFWSSETKAKRVFVNNIDELPEKFLEVYLNIQK